MNYGYPGSNTHLENHNVNEESFWPSFTDIMMVIVMVFLLVTVAVILNNWALISELKTSINAQHIASDLAENRQEKNHTLEAKLSSLEKQLVTLHQKYEVEKASLADTQQKLSSTTQNLTAKASLLTSIEEQLKSLNTKYETDKANLLSTSEKLADTDKRLLSTKEQLSTTNEQLSITKQKLTDRSAEITALNEKLLALTVTNDTTKNSLAET